MSEFLIKPVGIVKNTTRKEILKYSDGDLDLDLKSVMKQRGDLNRSEIIINEEHLDCLDGIEDFSHLVVLFWTHKTPEQARHIKRIHPAGIKKMPMKGIFATRSPVRPNPIGVTTIKLLERKENILLVERFDAIDNTPIIDIKPHLPFYDSPLDVKLADWMYLLMDELNVVAKDAANGDITTPYSTNVRDHPCISSEQRKIKK